MSALKRHCSSIHHLAIASGFILLFAVTGAVASHCDSVWDTTLSDPGFEGETIYAVTVYEGDLIAGGTFTDAGEQTVNHIARWDGEAWQPLGSGTNGIVQALHVHNGDLIAGGWFTEAGGAVVNHIARWDGNSWHAMGDGFNNTVMALNTANGDLFAGGMFTHAGDVQVNFIAHWDGIAWQEVDGGTNRTVRSIDVQTNQPFFDDVLLVGGNFTEADSLEANHVATWSPEGGWMALDTGFDGAVLTMTPFENTFLAGGLFQLRAHDNLPHLGTPAQRIQLWTGLEWTDLTDMAESLPNTSVQGLSVFDGQLYAIGRFTKAADVAVNHAMRFDGEEWHSLDEGLGGVFNSAAYDMVQFEDGIVVSGRFTTAGSESAFSIASWTIPAPAGPADLNCDGVVDVLDLLILLDEWGMCDDPDDCPADLNDDGAVDVFDLLFLIQNWG